MTELNITQKQLLACLGPFGLLWQNTTDWVAYTHKMHISHSFGGWKFQERVPAGSSSADDHFLGYLYCLLLAVCPQDGRATEQCGDSITRTLFPIIWPLPSWPNHFQKARSPYNIILEIKIQQNFGESQIFRPKHLKIGTLIHVKDNKELLTLMCGVFTFQSWVFFGRNDAKAETPVLWPPHAKSWLTGKNSDAGRDWGQEEKGMPDDEMVGWHHRPDGREFEWTPGVGDGQGGLACCNSWGWKELDTTGWLNWTELNCREGSTYNKVLLQNLSGFHIFIKMFHWNVYKATCKHQ